MSTTPKQMMREYVNSQNFTTTDEVMSAMKEMFKEVLQQVMECELSDKLGFEKSSRVSKNYRNGTRKRLLKPNLAK